MISMSIYRRWLCIRRDGTDTLCLLLFMICLVCWPRFLIIWVQFVSLLCSLCSSRKHQFFTQTQWTNVWVVFPVFPSNSHEKPRVCANLKSCNSDKMCSHIKTEVITGFTFDTINLLLLCNFTRLFLFYC